MLSALHSEWLLIFVCSILLILVGCSVMPRPTESASSTAPAQASMTFVIVPFATETVSTESTRPAINMTANISSEQIAHRYTSAAPPPELDVEVPICFGRANGGYSCFGKLWNRSKNTSGGAFLKVEVLDKSQQILVEQNISVEQNLIPHNTFATYRVLIDSFDGEKAEIRPTIMKQFPTSLTQSTLIIADERGLVTESGRYRLTATIENDLDKSIDDIRVFATLMNTKREVVGYRIYQVKGVMQPRERKAVDFEIIPQVYETHLSHVLHVEGHIEEDKTHEAESSSQAQSSIQP